MSIVLLARDLGLSISTVSRALNGYDDVLALATPPTAIVCATDAMAIGALAACRERERPPHQMTCRK